MGDFFDKHDEPKQPKPPETPKAPDPVYKAPDIKSLYNTFRETGQVPYSYYGVGAPTDAKELALVKQSYPGAFTAPTSPAPTPAPTAPVKPQIFNPLAALIDVLMGKVSSRDDFSRYGSVDPKDWGL